MFITEIRLTAPGAPDTAGSLWQLSTQELHQLGLAGESDVQHLVESVAEEFNLGITSHSWQHDSTSRSGSVDMSSSTHPNEGSPLIMLWSYDSLDDLDRAVRLTIPVDHHNDVVRALTPEQVDRYWEHVSDELDPFALFDDAVRQMGITPRDHDSQDDFVMRYVLALEWWRAFPTVEAGEQALDLDPKLTMATVAQILMMATRCFLEGQDYELADVLVYP